MAKFDDVITTATAHLEKHFTGHATDGELLRKVGKGLGPSLYSSDSSQVSCGSKDELKTVKDKFLMKKHGLSDEAAADQAIQEVCEQYKGARNKLRIVFYYVLVKKLGLEAAYA